MSRRDHINFKQNRKYRLSPPRASGKLKSIANSLVSAYIFKLHLKSSFGIKMKFNLKRFALTALFLFSSFAVSAQALRDEKYVSPFGKFACGPFTLETTAKASFGPHGGTVRFIDELGFKRIDIEEFQPVLSDNELVSMRELVYRGYLSDQILPLLKKAVPNAKLLKEQSATINGHSIYQSAILLPGESNSFSSEGKRYDGIRSQVEYTNGHYIYTISVISAAWQETREKQIEAALSYVETVFKQCEFP